MLQEALLEHERGAGEAAAALAALEREKGAREAADALCATHQESLSKLSAELALQQRQALSREALAKEEEAAELVKVREKANTLLAEKDTQLNAAKDEMTKALQDASISKQAAEGIFTDREKERAKERERQREKEELEANLADVKVKANSILADKDALLQDKHQQLQEKTTQLLAKDKQLKLASEHISALENEQEMLKNKLRENGLAIQSAAALKNSETQKFFELQRELTSFKSQVADLILKIAALSNVMKEKDAEIDDLQKRLAKRDAALAEKDSHVADGQVCVSMSHVSYL
jgi:hypothetical protein